jgi:hypothetical protein
MRYQNCRTNSKVPRKRFPSPGFDLSLDDFARWFEQIQPAACVYCGIPETLLVELGLRTNIDKPLYRLGIDRIDNKGPYSIGNIALCCYGCNSVKSNTYTLDEMDVLGPAIAQVWHDRLALKGIAWPEPTNHQ